MPLTHHRSTLAPMRFRGKTHLLCGILLEIVVALQGFVLAEVGREEGAGAAAGVDRDAGFDLRDAFLVHGEVAGRAGDELIVRRGVGGLLGKAKGEGECVNDGGLHGRV